MPVIVLMSQKGGVGKSTIAVHLATLAQSSGLHVMLVDMDPQQSALKWNASRAAERRFRVADALPPRRSKEVVYIVDTPPHTATTSAKAADAADMIVIPLRPARFDLDAVKSSVEIARLSRNRHLAVLSSVPHNSGGLAREASDRLVEWGVPVFDGVITQRAAFVHALNDGSGVTEFEPGGKAAAEIKALYEKIFEETRNDG